MSDRIIKLTREMTRHRTAHARDHSILVEDEGRGALGQVTSASITSELGGLKSPRCQNPASDSTLMGCSVYNLHNLQQWKGPGAHTFPHPFHKSQNIIISRFVVSQDDDDDFPFRKFSIASPSARTVCFIYTDDDIDDDDDDDFPYVPLWLSGYFSLVKLHRRVNSHFHAAAAAEIGRRRIFRRFGR